MKIKQILFFVCLIFLVLLPDNSSAQGTVLTLDAYLDQITRFHPTVKQANIQVSKAKADLLQARGSFDPTVSFGYDEKIFKSVGYYKMMQAELKIPTWLGIDFSGGIEDNSGQNINSENTLGNSSYIGVEIPLLKGLIMDKRRAGLSQAKLFRSQSEQEKNRIINDLMLEAKINYWEWTRAYLNLLVYRDFAQNAERRMTLTKMLFENGDRAMMDTVEASVQFQGFKILELQMLQEYMIASLQLSDHLWSAEGKPYLLPLSFLPDTLEYIRSYRMPELKELVAQMKINHPELKQYEYKASILKVEQQLKTQNLLPTLNLNGYLLGSNYWKINSPNDQNYKLGVEFKMPLFARQGAGDFQLARLKRQEVDFMYQYKLWQLENKMTRYFSELQNVKSQLELNRNLVTSYEKLLSNEFLRFEQGESSVFMMNQRELKLLETRIKQLDFYFKYHKTKATLTWTGGSWR